MTVGARRIGRSSAAAPGSTAPLSSDAARVQLQALQAERAAAEADLARLERSRDAVLLSGDDDAAERHDADMARRRRAIERCNLRQPAAEAAIVEADAREAAAALAIKQAQAREAVAFVVGKIETEYDRPRAEILAFVSQWQEACELADAAGVPSPETTLRFRAEVVEPSHEKTEHYWTFLDEDGAETLNEFPPGSYIYGQSGELQFDGSGPERRGKPVPPRRRVQRTRTVKVPYRVARRAFAPGSLSATVKLPPARFKLDVPGEPEPASA